MKLISHNYGKQRVRVLKVLRGLPGRGETRHEVKELEVGVRLEGDFALSYTAGDNSKVVPTDTMKNTVQVLAHRHLGSETEPFALLLARHFLERYSQVERVTIETSERSWTRLTVDGRPHDHAFVGASARPLATVVAARGAEPVVESGIEDLLIMKTTGSGFAGFPRDELTTLPETTDRVFATVVEARWRYRSHPADWNATRAAALDAMLEVFAVPYSPSVQVTLYEMAGAALAACPEIGSVTLALPNKHYLPANLAPFGLDSTGVSFVPTDEPHGQIEATVVRDGEARG
ncbi:MAG TPA: urate oxidase [Thermoanaerobaculia bacterium]|nr:urate oxidase [Thermoanaerobaculia bacterium]